MSRTKNVQNYNSTKIFGDLRYEEIIIKDRTLIYPSHSLVEKFKPCTRIRSSEKLMLDLVGFKGMWSQVDTVCFTILEKHNIPSHP